MSVKFQVVGIFYSTTVEIADVSSNNVGKIIQYLYDTDPNFYYSSIDFEGETIINYFGFDHPDSFTGRTGIVYPAGFYGLSQTFTSPTPNPYSVWQYYLFDQNNVAQQTNGAPSYTTATVEDGWAIVWRLPTILNGPGNLSKRLKKLAPKVVTALKGTP